ncbi:MAG: serine/threonine protein kinase [Prevotella sp.]|nr:serine/threonine protein kinase [Prevotella sp.]
MAKNIEYPLPIGITLTGGTLEYRIESVLGQGGFGITYKVSAMVGVGNIKNRISFAVKEHFVKGRCHRGSDGKSVEYSKEAAEDVENSLKSFIKEGKRLNKICKINKNIVDVNEVFEANNTAYYVMEYLNGGDLRQMIKDNGGGISEEKALSIIRPIANAVTCLHQERLLHLDIKPENIVLRKNYDQVSYEPVLIDFGIAIHFDSKGNITTTSNMAGISEGYSPREQHAKVTTFAPWMDVYSLAATALYLMTGKDPLGAFDVHDGYVESVLPTSISKRTRMAIANAMKGDYTLRTQSAKNFLNDLEGNSALPSNFILRGGHYKYRIVHVEEKRNNCYVYKAVIYTGAPSSSEGENITKTEIYTIYEFYVEEKNIVKRDDKGILIGLEPYDIHKWIYDSYLNDAQKLTGLSSPGMSNATDYTMNCELFSANGTFYLVKRDKWKKPTPLPFAQFFSKLKSTNLSAKTIKRICLIVLTFAIIVLLAIFIPKIKFPSRPSIAPDLIVPDTVIIDDTVLEQKTDCLMTSEKADLMISEKKNIQQEEKPITPQPKTEPTVIKEKTDDQKYDDAVKKDDVSTLVQLANNGYSKAYCKLAKIYLKQNNFSLANSYANKAYKANVGKSEAQYVVNVLDGYGYYDNNANQKPPF